MESSKMNIEDHYHKLENLYHSHPFNKVFNAKIKISKEIAEVTIPVNKELFHAAHAVHGAVYFKALDDAAFFSANSIVFDVFVLTTTFTTYLTRPVSSGILTSFGKLVNKNRTQLIAEAVLYNNEKEVGRGSGIYTKSKVLLNELVGYY